MAMIEELGIQREERTGAFPKLAENKQIKFRASLKMGNSQNVREISDSP